MAFQEIKRGAWANASALVNTVSFNQTKGSNSMLVTISQDIDKKLGSPMFISVLIGSGEHAGFVAFIPRNTQSSSAYKVSRATGKAVRFGISPKRLGVNLTPTGPRSLPFEITSDGLIVDTRQLRAPSLVAA